MGDHDQHHHHHDHHRPHDHYNEDHHHPSPHQLSEEEQEQHQPHYMRGQIQGHYNLFCINGDFFTPARRVMVNAKYHRDLPHLLDHLTQKLQPRFGAVRKICTPELGHRVRSLEDLQADRLYVAVDGGRLKHFGYGEINPGRKKSPPRNLDQWEPNKRYQVTSGKYKKIDTQATLIRCWANGRGKDGSKIVVLPAHRNRPEHVQDVVHLVSHVMGGTCGGAVCNLYETSGAKVRTMDQIRQNGCYVALKKREPFLNDDYQETPLPGLRFSPRLEKRRLPPIPNSNKTSSHSSPEHSTASHNGYRRERDRDRARRHPDDQVFTRPTKHKRSSDRARQTDYDQDNGGVFKAKNPNRATRGAREVEDSRYTHTELPVDQREAETVQDEEMDYPSPRSDRKEERRSREARERKGRKEEPAPAAQEKDRTHRTNARRAESPSNEQARREREEKEREARARREAEDRARKEKQQQQQEAMRRKKKEKEEQERRKREEEEERRKAERERQQQRKEEEKERQRKEEEKKERQRKEEEKKERQRKEEERKERQRKEEERKRSREEGEERRKKGEKKAAVAARRTPTPDRYEDTNDRSTRNSPAPNNDRPGTETLQDQQHSEAQQEEWAATRIQAGYRGYRDRQDLKQKKAEEEKGKEAEQEEWAATKIQAGFRGYRDRQDLKQRREERDGRDSAPRDAGPSPVGGEDDGGPLPVDRNDDDEQERAATKIQAGFRGTKARREVKAMREEKEVKDATATPPPPRPASKDPSLTRTVSPNPNQPPDNDVDPVSQQDAEHAAATKIQAAFRGQQTRKELAEARPAQEGGERNG